MMDHSNIVCSQSHIKSLEKQLDENNELNKSLKKTNKSTHVTISDSIGSHIKRRLTDWFSETRDFQKRYIYNSPIAGVQDLKGDQDKIQFGIYMIQD